MRDVVVVVVVGYVYKRHYAVGAADIGTKVPGSLLFYDADAAHRHVRNSEYRTLSHARGSIKILYETRRRYTVKFLDIPRLSLFPDEEVSFSLSLPLRLFHAKRRI